ncbi:hypothetical protein GF362_01640 [Candidatus Dojkabacteria bacterium]|nr:hypothetical protein [Candidatus Dojkabacteria bacterium]
MVLGNSEGQLQQIEGIISQSDKARRKLAVELGLSAEADIDLILNTLSERMVPPFMQDRDEENEALYSLMDEIVTTEWEDIEEITEKEGDMLDLEKEDSDEGEPRSISVSELDLTNNGMIRIQVEGQALVVGRVDELYRRLQPLWPSRIEGNTIDIGDGVTVTDQEFQDMYMDFIQEIDRNLRRLQTLMRQTDVSQEDLLAYQPVIDTLRANPDPDKYSSDITRWTELMKVPEQESIQITTRVENGRLELQVPDGTWVDIMGGENDLLHRLNFLQGQVDADTPLEIVGGWTLDVQELRDLVQEAAPQIGEYYLQNLRNIQAERMNIDSLEDVIEGIREPLRSNHVLEQVFTDMGVIEQLQVLEATLTERRDLEEEGEEAVEEARNGNIERLLAWLKRLADANLSRDAIVARLRMYGIDINLLPYVGRRNFITLVRTIGNLFPSLRTFTESLRARVGKEVDEEMQEQDEEDQDLTQSRRLTRVDLASLVRGEEVEGVDLSPLEPEDPNAVADFLNIIRDEGLEHFVQRNQIIEILRNAINQRIEQDDTDETTREAFGRIRAEYIAAGVPPEYLPDLPRETPEERAERMEDIEGEFDVLQPLTVLAYINEEIEQRNIQESTRQRRYDQITFALKEAIAQGRIELEPPNDRVDLAHEYLDAGVRPTSVYAEVLMGEHYKEAHKKVEEFAPIMRVFYGEARPPANPETVWKERVLPELRSQRPFETSQYEALILVLAHDMFTEGVKWLSSVDRVIGAEGVDGVMKVTMEMIEEKCDVFEEGSLWWKKEGIKPVKYDDIRGEYAGNLYDGPLAEYLGQLDTVVVEGMIDDNAEMITSYINLQTEFWMARREQQRKLDRLNRQENWDRIKWIAGLGGGAALIGFGIAELSLGPELIGLLESAGEIPLVPKLGALSLSTMGIRLLWERLGKPEERDKKEDERNKAELQLRRTENKYESDLMRRLRMVKRSVRNSVLNVCQTAPGSNAATEAVVSYRNSMSQSNGGWQTQFRGVGGQSFAYGT